MTLMLYCFVDVLVVIYYHIAYFAYFNENVIKLENVSNFKW
jgi:hypothetical protein